MEQSIGVSGLVSFILRYWGSKMYKIIVLGEKDWVHFYRIQVQLFTNWCK